MQPTLESLIEAARQLHPADRQRLAEALSESRQPEKRHITEIRGIGKDLWKAADAQDYINSERDAWEN